MQLNNDKNYNQRCDVSSILNEPSTAKVAKPSADDMHAKPTFNITRATQRLMYEMAAKPMSLSVKYVDQRLGNWNDQVNANTQAALIDRSIRVAIIGAGAVGSVVGVSLAILLSPALLATAGIDWLGNKISNKKRKNQYDKNIAAREF